jgi:hypothetical protein
MVEDIACRICNPTVDYRLSIIRPHPGPFGPSQHPHTSVLEELWLKSTSDGGHFS